MYFHHRFPFHSVLRSLAGALLLAAMIFKISGQVEDFCKGFLVGFIIGSFIFDVLVKKTFRPGMDG